MEKATVIPGKGLVVIDPKTRKPLPPEGAEVELTTYWRRRINDGSVTVAASPARKKPAAKKPDTTTPKQEA